MKKYVLFTVLIAAFIISFWYGCKKDPEETCKRDEICETKYVTTCCTEDECVYKYDGKEYPESQADQLAIDMGCGVTSAGLKSGNSENDLSDVIKRLQDLMEQTKKSFRSDN